MSKRPVEAASSGEPEEKKAKAGGAGSSDAASKEWKIGSDGKKSVADVLKKEETKAAVSSIKSKLSAPKVKADSLEDKRKQKHGTFSASLSRDQILQSQARHKEKMEALGKPVPVYSAPRR